MMCIRSHCDLPLDCSCYVLVIMWLAAALGLGLSNVMRRHANIVGVGLSNSCLKVFTENIAHAFETTCIH